MSRRAREGKKGNEERKGKETEAKEMKRGTIGKR